MSTGNDPLWQALGVLFNSHPWHGVSPGAGAPSLVTCFIEIVPTDTVKYELDKVSGLLKVDRPNKFSNVAPTLYGFVPQTLCGTLVAERCGERLGRAGIVGDDDPIDICVLSERPITHGNILVEALPIGGLRMIDGAEADDKIIAVMKGDSVYGGMKDIGDCPPALLDRLKHYFLTYKQPPEGEPALVEIAETYGRDEAYEVVRRSMSDYQQSFGGLADLLSAALRG
jgi:inorganic pyrophosphatase